MAKAPTHISIRLNETKTIILLDFPSCTAIRDSDEGQAAIADNNFYDYITSEVGRIDRKISTTGAQTPPILLKTRHTEPIRYEFRDDFTYTSNWEMYDTYSATVEEDLAAKIYDMKAEVLEKEGEFQEVDDGHQLNRESQSVEEEVEKLAANKRFFDAALVIERLLANNCHGEQQKKYKGLIEIVDQESKIYDYRLDLMWTLANEDTRNRCVTGICFSPLTEDILAVAYGKFYYFDRMKTGAIMLWNIKNPEHPERHYYFEHAVTSLEFSRKNPNFLAVGFYDGLFAVLDVSKRELEVVWEDSSSFEPVWDITHLHQRPEEYFLACFGDGRVRKYRVTGARLERVDIMRVNKVEGRLKGLDAPRMFQGNAVSSGRYASAVCLRMHPGDPFVYYVGTREGVVHRCIANYCTQHLDMFKAHEGVVHAIKFSPFVNKVYVTCGDDFRVCLWVEGISEPLLVSRFSLEPVLDVTWSTTHSTILVSLRGMDILLWDLQRKIYSPLSQTKSPTNCRNTLCRFTKDGKCLIVGDIDGNIHIFTINDLPHPPFFQENLFLQSMKNALVAKRELVKKLDAVGSLNFRKDG